MRNLVEEHVTQRYDALLSSIAGFCGCKICRSDVLVYALNRLPARYVATTEGAVLSEIALDRDQTRVATEVVLLEAFRKVGMAPRCGAAPSGGR
ncbi:MAG: late competence development ComFB family protein [Gemmatimonadales bacterium]|jgi:competence protein ComFB